MSQWDDLGIRAIIEEILLPVSRDHPEHHFRSPYLTPYQIAIEFAHNYPVQFQQLGLVVGGKDTGLYFSVAKYFANQLSRRIRSGNINTIEGCFVSNLHIKDIIFNHEGTDIHSSITGGHAALSMFRLRV
jgi:hypothetical protein